MDTKDILAFQIQRSCNVIARNVLGILEDIKFNHDHNFEKLKDGMPESDFIISQAEYLDDPLFANYRKKILDIIGEVKRELLTEVDKFNIYM